MPRIPIFRLGRAAENVPPPQLSSYTPALTLTGLQVGVDNLRHDVHLSPRFVEQARLHVARLIMRHGQLDNILQAESPKPDGGKQAFGSAPTGKQGSASQASELKPLLTEIQVGAINRAKTAGNLSLDLVARLAIVKFFRLELQSQFAQILERGRTLLKSYEGVRQQKALEYRERVAGFQVGKKIILRKAGQDLYRLLRDIEKENLSRTRRSLFGAETDIHSKLFLNPLIFTDDGRDIYLNAEQYVLFGNFDRDPDRFDNVRRFACSFLQSIGLGSGADNDAVLDGWLSVPDNAHELVGAGHPDEAADLAKARKARLALWCDLLDEEGILEHVIASYEVLPLLGEYAPRINAQQLKNALISREERNRVEKLIAEHGSLSPDALRAAIDRVANCSGAERAKFAGRFLYDFMRYHRDLRRLETVNSAIDSINLIANSKLRELSAMNGTLYEYVLNAEQRPSEGKILRHVVIKADVRDSTRLTRSLLEGGLNPASYFSLNFYDPVNKLLSKYGATKVFLEGDAIILAILEYEGDAALSVGRACVLAREMIEIVQGYNQLLQRAGLPILEIGVGVSFQDSPPMYLMDGDQRIMISDALNESDRLSSCNKLLRKPVQQLESPFRVYVFQGTPGSSSTESDESIMSYNLNGIRLSEMAFRRLQQEVSLESCRLDLPELWGSEGFELFSVMVPVDKDIFRRLVFRRSRIPQIEASDFSLRRWTERYYYEVCSNPAIYKTLEAAAGA